MDGTLTVAAHDFDAMRRELGLPEGQPILEALDELPDHEAVSKRERLHEMEDDLARAAQPQPDVVDLLATLANRGARLGILTRNTQRNALITLAAAGLTEFFETDDVLGREDAAPKPSPDGILLLLKRWGATGGDAVMVGDYVFDLRAGRGAGAVTVHFDVDGTFPFGQHADVEVASMRELLARVRSE